MELGTRWHIIECLYFSFSLLSNDRESCVSLPWQPGRLLILASN